MDAVFVALAPKGSFSIQEEDLRGTLREATRIVKRDGRLVVFYPRSLGQPFRRLYEQERLFSYQVTVSGEECWLEGFRIPEVPLS